MKYIPSTTTDTKAAQPADAVGHRAVPTSRLDRLRSALGFGWHRNRSLGLHLGDDAIRLAAVDVPSRRVLAVAERPLDLGDIVDGDARRPEAVRWHLHELATEFGVPRRRSLNVAIEADVDPDATQPPPGYTSTNVMTQNGRDVGEAFVRTAALEWLVATLLGVSPRVRIEPVATAILRYYADRVEVDEAMGISHLCGGRLTQVALDVAAYERTGRPVSVEATTTTESGSGSGARITGEPGSPERRCESSVVLAPALVGSIGDRVHEFAPAIGAALAPNGVIACDFRSGSVISRPADESTSPGWVLQRI